MVGHYHSHSHQHLPHHMNRTVSESSRDEQYSNGNGGGSSTGGNNPSSSDYSLAMSSEVGDISTLHHSTTSLLDSIERRTQRTYRYGIGLVCIGATLNWLGFAQGSTYHIDPLRYLGVACVLTGSIFVCISMCRWLGRPIAVSGHHVTNLEEERSNGDVHVINVAVPMYVPSLQEEYRPTKPPDYEQIVTGEPPPYDEAIKLSPGAFFGPPAPGLSVDMGGHLYASQLTSPDSTLLPCQTSPSHHDHSHSHNLTTSPGDLSQALLLDHQDQDNVSSCNTPVPPSNLTPRHHPHSLVMTGRSSTEGSDPPPAYEPSPRPSISSCSSLLPLIPTSTSRFELPPSFSVRRMFGGGGSSISVPDSPQSSPLRRREQNLANNVNDHLHDQVIDEDVIMYGQQEQSSAIPSVFLQGHANEASSGNANNI